MSMKLCGFSAVPVTLALVGGLSLGVPAIAHATPVIHGIDSYVGQQTDQGSIDLLQVEGAEGESVYFRIEKNGNVIADHLAFELAATTTKDDVAGIVSAQISDFDPTATYKVTVYADRAEATSLLYQGALQAVTSTVGGRQQVVAYSTKGAGEEGRQTQLPQTLSVGSDEYALVDGAYQLEQGKDTADGQITYVDETGNTLKTEPISDLAKGETRNVNIPGIIEAQDGKLYHTMLFQGAVSASYPGTRSFVIRCKEVSADVARRKGFYTATINLVDEKGTVLATDKVSVGGTVLYTAPDTLYKGSGEQVHTYNLAQEQVLTLSPDTSDDAASRVFSIAYAEQDSSVSASYAIVRVAVDPVTKTRTTLGTDEIVLTPTDSSKVYSVPQSVEVNGTTYVPANAKASYTYTWGEAQDPQRMVYYVPKDYVAENSYEVKVAYVNIATGQTIDTKSYTVSPDAQDDMKLQSPAQFIAADGTSYVRLGGQEETISHGYYTPYNQDGPTYTVYYRDANDDLNKDRTITRVRVRYVDGGSMTTGTTGSTTNGGPGSNTGNGNGASTNGTAISGAQTNAEAAADTTTARISQTGALSTVSGGGEDGAEQSLVNGEGNDLNTERIENDETPLANLSEGGTQSILRNPVVWGVVLAALMGVACALFFTRHKNDGKKQGTTNARGER